MVAGSPFRLYLNFGERSLQAKLITIFGEDKTIKEWAKDERCVVSYSTFNDRLKKGREAEEALTTPQQKSVAGRDVKVGDKLHRYTIKKLYFVEKYGQNITFADAECECGTIKPVKLAALIGGTTRSCGCYKSEVKSKECTERNYIHGKSIGNILFKRWCNQKFKYEFCKEWLDFNTFEKWSTDNGYDKNCFIKRLDKTKRFEPNNCYVINKKYSRHRIFKIWNGIFTRCYWVGFKQYCNYGGRGIKICEEWKNFVTFYNWSMKNNYDANRSIDKMDNNDHYCPNNCRWATQEEQNESRHNNRQILAFGKIKSIIHWTRNEKCNAEISTLHYRLNVLGWDTERAISTTQYYG